MSGLCIEKNKKLCIHYISMIELMDWALVLIVIVFTCIVSTGIWTMVGRYLADRRMSEIEYELNQIKMTFLSRRGEEARSLKAERMEQAMMEAAAIMQDPKVEDKKQALMALATKYPDIAMNLLKKYAGL